MRSAIVGRRNRGSRFTISVRCGIQANAREDDRTESWVEAFDRSRPYIADGPHRDERKKLARKTCPIKTGHTERRLQITW